MTGAQLRKRSLTSIPSLPRSLNISPRGMLMKKAFEIQWDANKKAFEIQFCGSIQFQERMNFCPTDCQNLLVFPIASSFKRLKEFVVKGYYETGFCFQKRQMQNIGTCQRSTWSPIRISC